jgi:protein-S-isoprenylcysteine O-methyltransferase Ste14
MLICKLIVSIILTVASFAVVLFLPAGTLNWWRAWVLVGAFLVATVATTVGLFPSHKDLLDERLKPPIQRGQPLADKIVLVFFLTTFVGAIVFIPLDVFRFHLLGKPGVVVSSLGMAFFVAGWWIITLSFKENAFAAPVVKHQEERQQKVIDTGVYGIVRHPMYAGGALFVVGLPLWLESYAATVLASLPIALLFVRIFIEEQFLKRELNSYDAYMRRVRYRLIPFLW